MLMTCKWQTFFPLVHLATHYREHVSGPGQRRIMSSKQAVEISQGARVLDTERNAAKIRQYSI